MVATVDTMVDDRVSLAGSAAIRRAAHGRARSLPRVDVCGIPVDSVSESVATARIVDAALDGEPLQVCTVNLQFLLSGVRDRRIRRILRSSGLNVADGAPVVWLSRLCGVPLPERVAGADLVPRLMDAAAEAGLGVYLLGGQDGVVEEAAAALRFRHPGLRVVGTCEPPLASLAAMDNDGILESIRASGADIVLVAFGHPRQELWIAANRRRLAAPVAIGVGCTFDLVAGRRDRAPVWMRAHGLEWLYRLTHEPRRLTSRYATQLAWLTTVLAPMAAAEGRRRRRDARRAWQPTVVSPAPPAADLLLVGRAADRPRAPAIAVPGDVGAGTSA